MSCEETEAASPPWGSHPHGAKGLWALGGLTLSTAVGLRTDAKPYAKRWVEAVVKPREDGAYVHQHLNFIPYGKVHGRRAKASNRTTGNPAVRHYRGATGNVSHGGTVNPFCNRKSRNGNPPPKAGRARALSQHQPRCRNRRRPGVHGHRQRSPSGVQPIHRFYRMGDRTGGLSPKLQRHGSAP